jgi:hypothetical protein
MHRYLPCHSRSACDPLCLYRSVDYIPWPSFFRLWALEYGYPDRSVFRIDCWRGVTDQIAADAAPHTATGLNTCNLGTASGANGNGGEAMNPPAGNQPVTMKGERVRVDWARVAVRLYGFDWPTAQRLAFIRWLVLHGRLTDW